MSVNFLPCIYLRMTPEFIITLSSPTMTTPKLLYLWPRQEMKPSQQQQQQPWLSDFVDQLKCHPLMYMLVRLMIHPERDTCLAGKEHRPVIIA